MQDSFLSWLHHGETEGTRAPRLSQWGFLGPRILKTRDLLFPIRPPLLWADVSEPPGSGGYFLSPPCCTTRSSHLRLAVCGVDALVHPSSRSDLQCGLTEALEPCHDGPGHDRVLTAALTTPQPRGSFDDWVSSIINMFMAGFRRTGSPG
jgi:hypothetical protein